MGTEWHQKYRYRVFLTYQYSLKNASKVIVEQYKKEEHLSQDFKNFINCGEIVSKYWHKHLATIWKSIMCMVKTATKSSAKWSDTINIEETGICK